MSPPQTPRRRRRKRPVYDECRSVYLAFLERRETPPGPTEMARLIGCSKGTASKACGWIDGVRTDGVKREARERYPDSGNG